MVAEFQLVRLSGGDFERGDQHGTAFRDAINRRLEALYRNSGAGSPEELGRPLARVAQLLAREAPTLNDEIAGIAAGAGIDHLEAVALNAFEFVPRRTGNPSFACTSFGISGEAGSFVGQNWDASPSERPYLFVALHIVPDGRATVVLASAGGLGWIGMNSDGVALVNNDLYLRETPKGLPSQAIRRLALAQSTAAGAVQSIRGSMNPGGRNYIVGDATGYIAGIEVAAGRTSLIGSAETFISHANHADDPAIRELEDEAALQAWRPSSRPRGRRAHLLRHELGDLDADFLRRALSDHHGEPFSICRHETDLEEGQTIASVIFDLRGRTAWFAAGNPCNTQFSAVRLA